MVSGVMKFLLIGSGGREPALCWSLAASPLVSELWCAPGSDAIAKEARRVPLAVDDLDKRDARPLGSNAVESLEHLQTCSCWGACSDHGALRMPLGSERGCWKDRVALESGKLVLMSPPHWREAEGSRRSHGRP